MQATIKNPAAAGDGHPHALEFTFEGKKFCWTEQYITGLQLKRFLNLPLESELYLEIQEPWKDEPVPDNKEIDLARPGIEQFFIKKKLPYTINGEKFESEKQYIRGLRIRMQGNIPANNLLYLSIKSPWEDELVEDNDWIDLARPGIEHFYSRTTAVEVAIIINGTPVIWNKYNISFKEVIIAAFGKYIDSPNMVYTVGYEDGPKQNPEGSMFKSDIVIVKNKMIFHATATDKS